MNNAIPISIGQPPAEPDDLRTLVEIDHRRSRIGLHITTDMTRAAYTGTSLWLDPHRAEQLAREILAACASWRQHEASVAWTVTTNEGGRA